MLENRMLDFHTNATAQVQLRTKCVSLKSPFLGKLSLQTKQTKKILMMIEWKLRKEEQGSDCKWKNWWAINIMAHALHYNTLYDCCTWVQWSISGSKMIWLLATRYQMASFLIFVFVSLPVQLFLIGLLSRCAHDARSTLAFFSLSLWTSQCTARNVLWACVAKKLQFLANEIHANIFMF